MNELSDWPQKRTYPPLSESKGLGRSGGVDSAVTFGFAGDQVPRLVSGHMFPDRRGFLSKGLPPGLPASACVRDVFWNLSHRNVVRGFHFYAGSEQNTKYIQVISGAIEDFLIDLRGNTENFGHIEQMRLLSDSGVLEVPRGFGHGYVTLEDDTRVLYATTYSHAPALDWGLSMIGLGLTLPQHAILSDRDRSFPHISAFETPF
jgi:dTDP-4-dehydrorhamnose 3,5-epimerase-like enzyme